MDGARIIDYGSHQNDTRIDWDDALRLGVPYEPSLYFWFVPNQFVRKLIRSHDSKSYRWGDEESELDAFDLLSLNSVRRI